MATETEHKFLVDPTKLPPLEGRAAFHAWSYLATSPTVRVRLSEGAKKSEAFLTIKGPGLKSRPEFEYPIQVGRRTRAAETLRKKTYSPKRVSK